MLSPAKEPVQISSDEESDTGDQGRGTKRSRLVYKHNSGSVELHTGSLECLNSDSYIKDNIVKFYLEYLLNEISPKSFVSKVHIFDNIFSGQLDKVFSGETVDVQKLKRLSKWYNGVNIFDKSFLIFPICSKDHWFVIIVCYPAAVAPTFDDDSDEDLNIDDQEVKATMTTLTNKRNNNNNNNNINTNKNTGSGQRDKTPAIIIMDSLCLINRQSTMRVRDFLDYEWRFKHKQVKRFSHRDLADYFPKLPRQTNAFDCGIYMLMYVRCFLEQPEEFYNLVLKADSDAKHSLRAMIRKCLAENDRESIKALIKRVCNNDS